MTTEPATSEEELFSALGSTQLLDVKIPLTSKQYAKYMMDPNYLKALLEHEKYTVTDVSPWDETAAGSVRHVKYSSSTTAWYGTFTSEMIQTQKVHTEGTAVHYQETVDAKFTGMPFMSSMKVITDWVVKEDGQPQECTALVRAEAKLPKIKTPFIGKKIEKSVLDQGKAFAQQVIADMTAKRGDLQDVQLQGDAQTAQS